MERSDTDAALVERVRRGDSAAFERLVRRHLRAAHAVAMSQIQDPDDADDLCQDAFMTALERIDQCRHPDRFRSWLLTIVRNRAHNFRAYRNVRAAAPLEAALASADGDDPAANLERSELRRDLAVALEHLTELQRGVLVLHDLEGWKHREIGERLGISAGSSRVHLHVARRALRKLLEPRYSTEVA